MASKTKFEKELFKMLKIRIEEATPVQIAEAKWFLDGLEQGRQETLKQVLEIMEKTYWGKYLVVNKNKTITFFDDDLFIKELKQKLKQEIKC